MVTPPMTPLFLARLCAFWTVMNAAPDPASDAPVWRIVSTRTVHVGLRPAAVNDGAGITLQISTFW